LAFGYGRLPLTPQLRVYFRACWLRFCDFDDSISYLYWEIALRNTNIKKYKYKEPRDGVFEKSKNQLYVIIEHPNARCISVVGKYDSVLVSGG
jgi:hypothetical protein